MCQFVQVNVKNCMCHYMCVLMARTTDSHERSDPSANVCILSKRATYAHTFFLEKRSFLGAVTNSTKNMVYHFEGCIKMASRSLQTYELKQQRREIA